MEKHAHAKHYKKLGVMTLLSFIAMYILMYAMVDQYANVYNHVNQLYMAGLMTAPMVLIELLVMQMMYPDPRLNAFVLAGAALVGALCWFGIREQTAVGDAQLLRSMIPHHAGAILMCEKASLTDPDVQALCKKIISSQREEIDFMKGRL